MYAVNIFQLLSVFFFLWNINSGLPHSDQGKIPCFPRVFNIFPVFWSQNIIFIPLQLLIDILLIIAPSSNTSQMQRSLLQKPYSIAGLSPYSEITFYVKRLCLHPMTNPKHRLNFKTSKFSPGLRNSLCVKYPFANSLCFPCQKKEHPNSPFFPMPW